MQPEADPEILSDDQGKMWLGGEAHVRLQGGQDARAGAWSSHDRRLASVILTLAFLSGVGLGSGLMLLLHRSRSD